MAERARLARRILARARRLSPSDEERRLLGSPLFDERWYSQQVGRQLGRRAAVRHYLEVGVGEGHHPHMLFDPAYVTYQYRPERQRRLGTGDPLGLYLRRETFHTGTHPLFDTAAYLARVPEAATHPSGPTAHYLEVGAAAGIPANDWLDADLLSWIAERRTAAAELLAAPPPVSELERTPAADEASLVSVVVVTSGDGAGATAAVASVLAHAADRDVECVVWDNGSRAEAAVELDALPIRFPGVRVIHAGRDLGTSRARNLALGHVTGALVVLVHDDVELPPGWLGPLLAPLDDPDVLGVQPVLVGRDLLVRSAGYAFPDRGLPHDFLSGFPVDDGRRTEGLRFWAVSGAALAVRRAQLLEVGGFDETLGGEIAEVDVCRRLAQRHGGRFRVAGGVVAVHHDRHPRGEAVRADRERYLRARGEDGAIGDDRELWAGVGFRLLDHDARSVTPEEEQLPPLLRVARPVLVREARLHTEPRPLRWAIKNPTPAWSSIWGDIHYAEGLAEGLRALGQEVVIDRHETFERPTVRHDDVALLIRGPEPARPAPEHPTLAWVISHPDTVTAEELHGYDAVFAASVGWADRRSREWGLEIEPLLQATDPARFAPEASPDTGAEVLFVGNTRGEFRPVVRDALAAGLDVTIFGVGWDRFLRPDQVAGRYLDNTLLSAAYRSAGVVLNDHFDDMRREGFISNRLFDALASGARVVSDEVAGLTELFGDAVPVYRTPADLRRLVVDRKAAFGTDEARLRLAESVRRDHSFRARAEVLLAAAHRAVARRR